MLDIVVSLTPLTFVSGSSGSSGSRTQSRDFAEKGTQMARTEDVNKESWMLVCISFFCVCGRWDVQVCNMGFLNHQPQPTTEHRSRQFFRFSSQSHLGSRQVECAQRSAEGEWNEKFWWLNFKLTDSGFIFLQLQAVKKAVPQCIERNCAELLNVVGQPAFLQDVDSVDRVVRTQGRQLAHPRPYPLTRWEGSPFWVLYIPSLCSRVQTL